MSAERATRTPASGVSKIGSSIKDEKALANGRERLLAGARRCFAERGFGGTSVQDIVRESGVSIGSMYKYVRSKEDLLWLMAETSHDRLRDVVDSAFDADEDPVRSLAVVVDALVRHADSDRDLVNLLYAEFKYLAKQGKRVVLEQEKDIVARLVDLIEKGNRSGKYHCLDPVMAAINIELFGSTWVLKNHLMGMTLEEYIKRQTQTAYQIVAVSPDDRPARAAGKARQPQAKRAAAKQ